MLRTIPRTELEGLSIACLLENSEGAGEKGTERPALVLCAGQGMQQTQAQDAEVFCALNGQE